ncbi:hypothetical protein [Robertmurraya sp.]|uniref:hypothetical protein n=1 Tax=Robertmurraya sp. TaxID=2837525 RepID=UPI003703C718
MKVINDWKRHLKSYSFISLVGILFSAISVTGLSALGVLGAGLSMPVLATLVTIFAILGGLGRFIDQTDDNISGDGDVQ